MISAVGRAAVECVLNNAPKVGALVARHYDIALEESYRQGECDAQMAATLCKYDVPSLILSRRNFDGEHNGITLRRILTERLLDHPVLLKLVRGTLESGVQRQADVCLLDVPSWIMGDIVVHRLSPVRVKPGVYFVVGAVSFRSGLHLSGPWYAGHLQSRGYGRIFSARSAAIAKTA